MLRAPIEKILPSFIPSILERGVPGYKDVQSIPGEKRLSSADIRSLFVASVLLGTLEHAGNKDFDIKRVRQILTQSVSELNELSSDEKTFSLQLVESFYNFKIIRAEHPFDDWVCEALWEKFQNIPYAYPSAMSTAISYGLTINHTLSKCSLEY